MEGASSEAYNYKFSGWCDGSGGIYNNVLSVHLIVTDSAGSATAVLIIKHMDNTLL